MNKRAISPIEDRRLRIDDSLESIFRMNVVRQMTDAERLQALDRMSDEDVRLMRKVVEDDTEPEEDEDRTDAEAEEDEDRKKKAKADDDQDDADEAEERDRMNDMYVMRGYSIRRFRDAVVDVAAEAGGQVDVDDLAARSARRVALHEAGHCVVAVAQGRKIQSATVVAGSDYAGKVSEDETPEMMKALLDMLSGGRATVDVEARARDHVVGYMAGTISEWLFCPLESWRSDRNSTASSDLKLAKLFARAITGVEEEAEELLVVARTEARDILEAHRHLVAAVADALMTRGTMTGDEIDEIIDGA